MLSVRSSSSATFCGALNTVSVLLIRGTGDPFFPIAEARDMLPSFGGGADLHEIAGGKLSSHEDHPDDFVGAARPFLRAALLGEVDQARRPKVAIT